MDDDTKKCDCILFDDSSLFFAELKASSSGTRSTKRKKAKEQLAAMLDVFKTKNINTNGYKLFAIIAFKSTEPRIINTSSQTDKANFLSTYNTHLLEQNVIDFL